MGRRGNEYTENASLVYQLPMHTPKRMISLPLRAVSFGTTAAILTSTGLIVGFSAAGLAKSAIIAGLLIACFTDNLTDALSIHIFQESELQEQSAVFRTTMINFAARLTISLSFVALTLGLSGLSLLLVAIAWGGFLLSGLTWLIARSRGAEVSAEITKHLAVAVAVITVSRAIGELINLYVP